MRKHGFTLIELLIVVAIIAILAAIAVPNFLEAQTRSKVSRVKADMRSIATAIEAYNVDNNREPVSSRELTAPPLSQTYNHGFEFYFAKSLSTPVAYMSSIPGDPFFEGQTLASASSDLRVQGDPFRYDSMSYLTKAPNTIPTAGHQYEADAYIKGYRWSMNSLGPSKLNPKQFSPAFNDRHVLGQANKVSTYYFIYDPTNGTISGGYIIRSNFGDYSQPR